MKDCACEKCVLCCSDRSPGWFKPGEAEKAAAFLGMAFKDFKNKYLVIDYWCRANGDVEVYAPLKQIKTRESNDPKLKDIYKSMARDNRPTPGERVSWGYAFQTGRCVVLNEKNLCDIHPVKPYECRMTMGCTKDKTNLRRKIVATILWARRKLGVAA